MTPHFRTCTLCEAMCGIVVETDGGRVTTIRGDRADPFSRGHICPKAMGLKDLHEDPDRLRRPVRREGARWQEISWEDALDETARRLRAVQDAHGRDAVALYQGNPTVHNYGSLLFAPPFARTLRTRNTFSATSVDQLPHMLAAHWMFGHQLMLPIPDLDRTRFLLVLGANPVVSNGSLMTAPDVTRRLRAIRERGGRMVVVDPRRTETSELADEHHFVRPGGDAFLLLGLLHALFAEQRTSLGRCAPFTSGLDEVRALVLRFPPERVAGRTGIEASAIRALARSFASAESAVAYCRVGASTQEFGALACWLVTVLNVVTGNLDREGGAMFTLPAVDILKRIGRGHFGKWKSRVRGLPEFSGELPVAAMAEEMDTPGATQIRALVTSAGNPVLSTPNGGRLERALAKLDFMVSVDFFVNETTRFAHLILPPTGPLEHDHYDLAFHALAIRNTTKYSEALFAPAEGTRHDWQIFNELTWRMTRGGTLARLRARAQAAALARLGPHGMLDVALRIGPRGASALPPRRGLRLRDLREAPHGIDLGPLEPCLPERLFTRDGRLALAPPQLVDDVARLEARLAQDVERPRAGTLELIGRRELRSNNSWMHNSLRLVKGPARCTLRMHPGDAAARGLAQGALVRITSRVGEVVAPVDISDEMMPGVVSLPHGWGHDRQGARLAVAAAHPGVSINELTDDQAIDALSGNASFSGVPVEVRAC
jgi:anaerobic selenocysteine-containing dehydrogenase